MYSLYLSVVGGQFRSIGSGHATTRGSIRPSYHAQRSLHTSVQVKLCKCILILSFFFVKDKIINISLNMCVEQKSASSETAPKVTQSVAVPNFATQKRDTSAASSSSSSSAAESGKKKSRWDK